MMTMKKSVLTAFITVVCATSSVMAADDNAITDGKVTFNGKVIAPACTLVAGDERFSSHIAKCQRHQVAN